MTEVATPVPAKKSVWDKLDVQIEHDGRAITLPAEPEKMPTSKAIEALQRRLKDEEQPYEVHEIIDAFPHDGAVAFVRAMKNLYGFASFESERTFWGPQPPQLISVKTGVRDEDVIQCPMGQLMLPGVDQPIKTMIYTPRDGSPPFFLIMGTIKKKYRHVVLELATETRRLVREQSIYRGKPIRLGVDEVGNLNMGSPPTFMDVTEMTEESLLFDPDIRAQIHTNILVPIKDTVTCRKHQIPLKRTALLEGPFGTGKSLTARMIARVAELHGWTFILLDRVQGLRVALEFANRYAPAVVFAEDIDRIAEVRDDATNDLINIIDGVVSKRSEVMTVLTTNHVEKLDPVILRPGRLDAIISIRAPGPDTVQRLIRHYATDLLPLKANLKKSGEELSGQIPASIRECVERAKLGMIGRHAHELSDDDIVVAAKTMKNHLALLNKGKLEVTPAETLATSLREVIGNGTADLFKDMAKKIEEIHNSQC